MLSTDFVKSYIDAWNEQDSSRVANHLAKGGTYHDMAELRHLSRRDFITHLEEYFSRDSNRYVLVGEILEGNSTFAFQYLACSTGNGLHEDSWMGAEFITLEGSTATRIEDYYRDPRLSSREISRNSRERYAKSGLNDAAMQAVLRRLGATMDEDRVYLNSHLSLPELAANLGCSVNHLSQAINEGHGLGFFDYVNSFRIRDARELLSRADVDIPSVLEVALSVGFNSNSTFYAAFKRITGKTPAGYRRETLEQAARTE